MYKSDEYQLIETSVTNEEDLSSYYYVEVAKTLYGEFSEEEKSGFDQLLNDNKDFQYLYDIFKNDEITASALLLQDETNENYYFQTSYYKVVINLYNRIR